LTAGVERLPGDAMAGDGALFTPEDAIEAVWGELPLRHDSHPHGVLGAFDACAHGMATADFAF
jgi:hypothetical protein